jgi:hypothetical protein
MRQSGRLALLTAVAAVQRGRWSRCCWHPPQRDRTPSTYFCAVTLLDVPGGAGCGRCCGSRRDGRGHCSSGQAPRGRQCRKLRPATSGPLCVDVDDVARVAVRLDRGRDVQLADEDEPVSPDGPMLQLRLSRPAIRKAPRVTQRIAAPPGWFGRRDLVPGGGPERVGS